jgi:hypothetical protein
MWRNSDGVADYSRGACARSGLNQSAADRTRYRFSPISALGTLAPADGERNRGGTRRSGGGD